MDIIHRQQIVKFLASGFYTGHFPFAPGTAGSVVGLLAYIFIRNLPDRLYIGVLVLVFGTGVYLAKEAESIYREKDSSHIVVDEIAGMLLTFLFIPWSISNLIAGFISFRIMDIIKPFPIRVIENRLSGGWGIMVDDIIAGIYAALLVVTVSYILNIVSVAGGFLSKQ